MVVSVTDDALKFVGAESFLDVAPAVTVPHTSDITVITPTRRNDSAILIFLIIFPFHGAPGFSAQTKSAQQYKLRTVKMQELVIAATQHIFRQNRVHEKACTFTSVKVHCFDKNMHGISCKYSNVLCRTIIISHLIHLRHLSPCTKFA